MLCRDSKKHKKRRGAGIAAGALVGVKGIYSTIGDKARRLEINNVGLIVSTRNKNAI